MNWLTKLLGAASGRQKVDLSAEQCKVVARWRELPVADLNVPHADIRYVVVDVESSGLNMKRDRLISIGAVALVNGRLDFNDAFQVVLRQDQVSTHANILIHGIGGAAQSGGVDQKRIWVASWV